MLITSSGGGARPTPPFQRMMIFIDGENLVMRYQATRARFAKDESGVPRASVEHDDDVYAWEPRTVQPGLHEILRANYYTSAQGSDERISSIEQSLRQLRFSRHYSSNMPDTLYPRVFRKSKKQRKTRMVDMQITVDILVHTYQDNLDAVYLVSADRDYLPVVNEVLRKGKQVYLAAFSDGLSSELRNAADVFVDLDPVYFER